MFGGVVISVVSAFVFPSLCAESPPQLEVLFPSSSPDLPWPPAGVDLDTPGEDWPGHLQQLAKQHPRHPVDVAYNKGFPGPEDFYKNFVSPQRPVVFREGLDYEVMEQLKTDKWNQSGRAALSFIEVANFKSPQKLLMSGREFVKGRAANQWYSRGHLHKNLKDMFLLPRCLACSYLTDILFDSRHVLFDYAFPLPVKQDKFNQLTCLIEGSKELLLVSNKEFPQVSSLLEIEDPPYGSVSMLNSFMADFSQYPALKHISKFHISLLGPGDCLYIPAGWISQTNVLSRDNSVELRWEDKAWTPDPDCLKGPRLTLSEFSFPGENFVRTDRTRDKRKKLVTRASHLLDKVVDRRMDVYRFIQVIAKDETLLPNLMEWTLECSTRAEEFFKVLDLNHDGFIDNDDVDALTVDSVEGFLGLVEDRLSDMDDIIIDQRVDFSLTHTKPPTAREREKQVKEIIEKVKKDIDSKGALNVGDEKNNETKEDLSINTKDEL